MARCGFSIVVSRTSRSGRRAQAAAARHRGGFTLVELMVAILIMTVGLLGMTGSAAVVARQMRASANQATAAQVAQSRLEWLRAAPCLQIGDSTTTTRGVQEKWTHTKVTKAVVIVDSVSYSNGRGQTRSQAYTTMVPCS